MTSRRTPSAPGYLSHSVGKRIGLVIVCALLVASSFPLATSGGIGNDANTNKDAPDSKDSSLIPTIAPGRYAGTLAENTDLNDWYRISVPTFTGTTGTGRPVLDVVLMAVPTTNDLVLELWTENEVGRTSAPMAVGAGGTGVKSLHHSLDRQGAAKWLVHVGLGQDGNTGAYELTVNLKNENDAGSGRDGGRDRIGTNLDAPQTHPIALGSATDQRLRGVLSPGDSEDVYTYTFAAGEHSVFVGLHFGSTNSLTIVLEDPTPSTIGTVIPPVSKTGNGFATSYSGSASGQWRILVDRPDNQATEEAAYVMTLHVGAPGENDPGKEVGDASDDFGGATALPAGIFVGSISDADGGDPSDTFALPNLQPGQLVALGVSSHLSASNRPWIRAELFTPQRTSVASATACGGSAGIFQTADIGGTWYVQVTEIGNTQGCTGASPIRNAGDYSISFDTVIQPDLDTGDAPTSNLGAPTWPGSTDPSNARFLAAMWSDGRDLVDSYSLGTLAAGQTVRAAAVTNVEDLEFKIHLIDGSSQIVATAASENGRAKIQKAVATGGNYVFRFEQTTLDGDAPANGQYRAYALTLPNQPPVPVTLDDPDALGQPADNVGRNYAKLHWTREVDDDFLRYEVYGSTQAGFIPAPGTLRATVTARDTVDATASGLTPERTYEFLVRTYDASEQVSDSNRVTATTDSGPLTNGAPTLRDPTVDPGTGTTNNDFTYSVTYTDPDNDPPARRQVTIDGANFDMSASATTYSNGVRYSYTTRLPVGNHQYSFHFSDGTVEVHEPSSGQRDGPSVTSGTNRAPTATASANPSQGNAPLTVQFDVTASDPDGDPLTYSWDFDNTDGLQDQSTVKSPSYTYNKPGTYLATVKVRDNKGAETSRSVTVVAKGWINQNPTVSASATPSSGQFPLTVKFTSTASDADGTIASYSWDFDNTNGQQVQSTQQNPTHTYNQAGTFVATVTVKDNSSGEGKATVTVTVSSEGNLPPTITVDAAPLAGKAPLDVYFNATTTDPDGDTVQVKWDFDAADGVTSQATGASVKHTFTKTGKYNVTAVATDSEGATAAATAEIIVHPASSDGLVSIHANPVEGRAPLRVEFSANVSGLNTTAQTFEWDFGDGQSGAGETVSHRFESAGDFEVSLIVTDEQGIQYESTVTIKVSAKKSPSAGPLLSAIVIGLVVFAVRTARRRDE